MTGEEVEAVYEAIASELDKVGTANTELYLAKLALLLANEIGDRARAMSCIAAASKSLE